MSSVLIEALSIYHSITYLFITLWSMALAFTLRGRESLLFDWRLYLFTSPRGDPPCKGFMVNCQNEP